LHCYYYYYYDYYYTQTRWLLHSSDSWFMPHPRRYDLGVHSTPIGHFQLSTGLICLILVSIKSSQQYNLSQAWSSYYAHSLHAHRPIYSYYIAFKIRASSCILRYLFKKTVLTLLVWLASFNISKQLVTRWTSSPWVYVAEAPSRLLTR